VAMVASQRMRAPVVGLAGIMTTCMHLRPTRHWSGRAKSGAPLNSVVSGRPVNISSMARLLFLFFCLLSLGSLEAQAGADDTELDLRRLFEMSQPDLSQFSVFDLAGPQSRNPTVPAEVWEAVRRDTQEELKLLLYGPGGAFEKYIQELARRFSSTEIRSVLGFFESELGQKWVRESTAVAASTMSREQVAKVVLAYMGVQQQVLKKHGLRP
jgi:hypothetical protein